MSQYVLGATMAYNRLFFDEVGGIHPKVISEDTFLCLLGFLYEGNLQVPGRLVKYRKHENNISNVGQRRFEKGIRIARNETGSVAAFKEKLPSLEKKGMFTRSERVEWIL